MTNTTPNALFEDQRALEAAFSFVNQQGKVPTRTDPVYPKLIQGVGRVEVDPGHFVPQALEAARILRNLRQRLVDSQIGNDLVGRFRAEVQPRFRPIRDQVIASLDGATGEIGRIGGLPSYSKFQIDGWTHINGVLDRADAGHPACAVITAPTSSGKTEVFLLPMIRRIARIIADGRRIRDPRYVFVYPRRILAQDQLARIFKYVRNATVECKLRDRDIVIGIQYGGVATTLANTLANRDIFDVVGNDYLFKPLDRCPWCPNPHNAPRLQYATDGTHSYLSCPSCNQRVRVSLSKDDHAKHKPQVMITTAESLDLMLMSSDFQVYLSLLNAIVVDEAHIFNQIYGAHVHQILRRVRDQVQGANSGTRRDLAFIASSATIDDPADFANRLFFGGSDQTVGQIVEIVGSRYPQELSGLETLFFLQIPEDSQSKPISTMIQAAMATGHALLTHPNRMIIFADSLGIAGRLNGQIHDAETNKRLFSFRTGDHTQLPVWVSTACPSTTPARCDELYNAGECWRGIIGGIHCWQQPLPHLRAWPLTVQLLTGQTEGMRTLQAPIVVGTSALEVGIDDEFVKVVAQYRPPRTVFDFVQRRGRAGRRPNDIATTLVVLGDEGADYFYIIRRHRLINGIYQIPLNPDNPVVCEMHRSLDEARTSVAEFVNTRGKKAGLWEWVLRKLTSCVHLQREFGAQLQGVLHLTKAENRIDAFANWVFETLPRFRQQLSTRLDLPLRAKGVNTQEIKIWVDELRSILDEWNSDPQQPDISARLDTIAQTIEGGFRKFARSKNQTERDDYSQATAILGEVEALIRQGPGGVEAQLDRANAYYNFFSQLAKLFEQGADWRRNYAPEVIRKVLQALHYLHDGIDADNADNCPAHIPHFVPDSYFDTIEKVNVAIDGRQGDLKSEPVSFADTQFAPYRTDFRYEHRILYALRTQFRSVSARANNQGNPNVTVFPSVRGPNVTTPDNNQARRIQSLTLQPLSTDDLQQVGFCPNCYQLYDVDRNSSPCRCGGQIILGRISHCEADTLQGFSVEPSSEFPFHPKFQLLRRLRTWTTIRGSHVRFSTATGADIRFNAWLSPHLHYSLRSRGIRWQLPELAVGIDRQLTALSAAQALRKTIASISGVREDQLSCGVENPDSVVVWERIEGGAGISEVFQNTLTSDPVKVYRELVAAVACPVYLGEQKPKLWSAPAPDQSKHQLLAYLSRQFGLDENDETLLEIADAAVEESAVIDPQLHCSHADGCPACIRSSETHQDIAPRRSYAWEVVRACVQQLPHPQAGLAALSGAVLKHDARNNVTHILVF